MSILSTYLKIRHVSVFRQIFNGDMDGGTTVHRFGDHMFQIVEVGTTRTNLK